MRTALLTSRDRPLVNLALFALTLLTTFWAFFSAPTGLPFGDKFVSAVTFAVAVLLILGSHEMGHYLYARFHGVDSSLPYFIPMPIGPMGTLGAVIRIRSRIPDVNALVDIGAAGPL